MQNSQVTLVTTTQNGQDLISEMARVSNPDNAKNTETSSKLIRYLLKNKHYSPFEMVHMVVSIKTSRTIARQLLRHRSFSFQEFSQRYQNAEVANRFDVGLTEARLQDTKNRQNSLETDNVSLQRLWKAWQERTLETATMYYEAALKEGIAKEVARVLLPEGLTATHLYMSGTLRSWIHFCELRCGNGTQKEATDVANKVKELIKEHYPDVYQAVFEEDNSN